MKRLVVLCAWLATVAAASPARADNEVATYALVVGSNAAGPGQTELRYAEDDARKVGALLAELGGYTPDTVDVVLHPTPDLLRERLTKLSSRVAADLAAGRQTRVLFYYSGHARATAIDLGTAELPLAELRQRLFASPATLTVVVLDACQSGAFSRVRGATPAADFSYNSRQHLDASGLAVLASSSSAELSQESDRLKSGYFTHHLLVGLRGAGDANGDGTVSIDEAYRYAYHQTLLATAETAVGGQHVSLEVDLKGHGEVPLSFPRSATAAIALPGALEGQTLVEDRKAHAVVAEIYKAKGAPVRIAVAPGDYDVLVRHGDRIDRCPISTGGEGTATVDLARCTSEPLSHDRARLTRAPRMRVELGVAAGNERIDGYSQRLSDFGFHDDVFKSSPEVSLTGLRELYPKLWVGGQVGLAGSPQFDRSAPGVPDLKFDWQTYTLGGVARGEQPVFGRLSVYGQLGLGLGLARTHFLDQDGATTNQTYLGPALSVGTGLHFELRHLGFSAGYQFEYAPIIDNLTGDTHASGGHRLTAGVSYTL